MRPANMKKEPAAVKAAGSFLLWLELNKDTR